MLKQPDSVDECVYFTRRSHAKGFLIAWALRGMCKQCNKGIMGKPTDEKGKVKIRAKEYSCKQCGFTQEKEAYEDTLTASIIYDCPHCGAHGELNIPFKRKKAKIFDNEEMKPKTVEVLRFVCQSCKQNIDITKKMK